MRYLIFTLFFTLMISLGAGEYKVQPGDTLSKIAEAQLGDANLWKEIADLNGIKKPYVVKVGQTLSIPNYEDEHESVEEILQSLPEEDSSDINFTWQFITLAVLISWLYWTICLKAGCWFSLVEVTWKKCFLFPIVMIICFLIIVGISYFIPGLMEDKSIQTTLIWGGIFMLFTLIATTYFMKKYFDCKWRSVLTIHVMTSVLANILSFLTLLGLSFILPNTDAIQKIVAYFST